MTLVLVAAGIPQTLSAYREVTTVEGLKQMIALGPVASQEVIKELGTNGGGFFNANSAHPFESPTPLTNFIEMVLIFAIPAGLTYTYGKMAAQHAPGLGALRGHGGPVGCGRDGGLCAPSPVRIRLSPPSP